MKGHFTHLKRGWCFHDRSFNPLTHSLSVPGRFPLLLEQRPNILWDAARLLFRFLPNPSKRLLFRVPFLRVPKNNRCCRFCERKPERLSAGDRDGTERLPGGQTGWERRLLGWYFRSCWDRDQPLWLMPIGIPLWMIGG